MNENQDIDTTTVKLVEIPKALKALPEETAIKIFNDMAYGGSSSIPDIELIPEFLNAPQDGEDNEIHACFKAAIYSINFFSSEDPSKLHYQVAREVLREAGGDALESQEKARDTLARALVKECRNFASKIIPSELLQEKASDKFLFVLCKENSKTSEHLITSVDGMLWLDECFVSHIEKVGKKGLELAKKISDASKVWGEEHKANKAAIKLFRLWIDLEEPPYYCRYLGVLAKVIWEDRVKQIVGRQTNNCPSLVKPVIDRMVILNNKRNNQFIEKEEQIIYCDQKGSPLIIAPALDEQVIATFKKGINGLGTLTGHKLLRWQVRTGFERWAQGESDPRLIEIDGGYSRIAEYAKCTSKTDIAKIKEILQAQAYGRLMFSDGSQGNMITLNIMEKYRNEEPSKINIVLGEMLLPSYVFQLERSDRLLIPFGELPPLHGSPNSHASQAQLQLLVFREFSNQSNRLVQEGSVLITKDQWRQLAQEADLPTDKVDIVVRHWCQPDLFNCFLERQGDEFRLASYYDKAQKFLEDQGKRRAVNSERGKKSAEKRANKLKK